MKKPYIFLLVFITLLSLSSSMTARGAENEQNPYSLRITRSEMNRCPEGKGLDYVYNLKWQYSVLTELEAMIRASDCCLENESSDIVTYALDYLDKLIDQDGNIYKYKMTDYNLDHVKGGTLLLYAYDKTGNNKYLTAANTLWNQLKSQPTTSDGGYWHKNIYPYQMWLDGLFMAEPFAAKYASKFLSGQELEDAFTKIVKQFTLATTHTYDPATGLYRHGWDEKKVQPWADKTTGQSAHAWGRAMGWTFMAIPYVLDEMPADHPERETLETLYRNMASAVISAQDPETGLWWQVLDCPGRDKNYLEATASAMFVYSMLRGHRMGILDDICLASALKGWDGILSLLVVEIADGSINLTQCCSVGGLGGSANRDGSFEYYVSEQIRDNDAKGMGPFINAAIEIELLDNLAVDGIQVSSEIDTTVYDLHGRRISPSDITSLPAGIYIMIKPGVPSRKIIIK